MKFLLALIFALSLSPANAQHSYNGLWKQVGNYNPPDGTLPEETSILVDQTGVVNSGRPITITFTCGTETGWPQPAGNTSVLIIRDYFSRFILKEVPWPAGGYRGFAVNQTIGGLIHIFSTLDPQNQANANAFVHATLDNNFNLGTTQTIYSSSWYGGGIAAIAGIASPNPQGGWSINYANQYGVAFLDWPDANFTPGAQSTTNPNGYVVVPSGQPFTSTVESVGAQWNAADGYWYSYVQYLTTTNGVLVNLRLSLSRSTDRANWTYSNTILLYPDMPNLEGIDASDIRVIEYQGTVYIIYGCGDQQTWSAIRTATYPGTLAQLRAQFF